MRRTGALLFAALALMAMASCSSSDDSSTTTTASRGFEISTEDGQASISLSGDLPDGWPSSFPLPSGATAAGSGSLGGSSSTDLIGVFTSDGTPEEVFTFYTEQSSLTVDSKASLGNGENYVGTVKFSGAESGRVTVLPKDGQTLIVIALQTAGTTNDTTSAGDASTATTTAG